jgi:hypothetical protein
MDCVVAQVVNRQSHPCTGWVRSQAIRVYFGWTDFSLSTPVFRSQYPSTSATKSYFIHLTLNVIMKLISYL